MPESVVKELVMNAYEDVRSGARRFGSPEATQLLGTLQGWRELLFLHGRKAQPELTRDDWESVILAAVESDLARLADNLGEGGGGAIQDLKSPPSSSTEGDARPTGETSSSPSPSATAGQQTP